MDEQYKKMLEELSEIRRNNKGKKIKSIRPSGLSSILNMDFSSLYPTPMTYHFKKSMRIIKGKKILKNIKEDGTKI